MGWGARSFQARKRSERGGAARLPLVGGREAESGGGVPKHPQPQSPRSQEPQGKNGKLVRCKKQGD